MRLLNPTQSSSTHTTKYIFRRNLQISKLSIYLTHPFVYFLLLGTYFGWSCATNVGDYLPVGAQLTLPQGFRPPQAPYRPMLLPFATPAPNSPSGGWKPIVGDIVRPTHSIRRTTPTLVPPSHPTLTDCIDINKEQSGAQLEVGHVLESVVYGTWKPGRPLRPEEMQASTTPRPHTEVLKTTIKKSERPTSLTRPTHDGTQALDQRFIRKIENRRFPNTRSQNTTLSPRGTLSLNKTSSAPNPNSNFLQPTKKTFLRPESATEAEAITESVSQSIDVKKIWPTDFVPTMEQDREQHKHSSKNLNYSLEHETPSSSYHPNNFKTSTIAETLLPQIPLNITKVGVPYENVDSAEGPKICVPISVIEESSQMEIERVYCFPLPPPYATEASKAKGLEINLTNYTEYGEVNGGERLSINFIGRLYVTLLILYFLLDKNS